MVSSKLFFKLRSKICIMGGSGNGKTQWLMKYLTDDNRFDRIIWCAPSYSLEQDKIKSFKQQMKNKLILIEGLDETKIDTLLKKYHTAKENVALVIDDLMSKQGNYTVELFTAGRHLGCTIFELTQSVFNGGSARTQQLNSQYFVLFAFSDNLSIINKFRQMSPMKYRLIFKAYQDAISKQYGCFIVDTITNQYDLKNQNILRFRDTELNVVYPELADI